MSGDLWMVEWVILVQKANFVMGKKLKGGM